MEAIAPGLWLSGLSSLAHVLILVFWLGGDLGVFTASFMVADPRLAAPARVALAKLLFQLDMAPRSAMILALPTGLALAGAAGWAAPPPWLLAAVWLAAAAWLALAWSVHLRHLPPGHALRRADLAVRWLAMGGLAACAAAADGLPVFIRAKLIVLAACIALGLWVRRALVPFGPAFSALAQGRAGPAEDAAIAASLARARLPVLAIWMLIATAALLGAVRPA